MNVTSYSNKEVKPRDMTNKLNKGFNKLGKHGLRRLKTGTEEKSNKWENKKLAV